MTISVQIEQDPVRDAVTYTITLNRKELVDANPPGDMQYEFNPMGGISADLVEGGWPEHEAGTRMLRGESLAALLLRMAYMAAVMENTP